MAEAKKIHLQLHTPILIPGSDEGAAGKSEAVYSLTGILSQVSEAGIWLKPTGFKNERDQSIKGSQRELFLPQHKIDHFWVMEA